MTTKWTVKSLEKALDERFELGVVTQAVAEGFNVLRTEKRNRPGDSWIVATQKETILDYVISSLDPIASFRRDSSHRTSVDEIIQYLVPRMRSLSKKCKIPYRGYLCYGRNTEIMDLLMGSTPIATCENSPIVSAIAGSNSIMVDYCLKNKCDPNRVCEFSYKGKMSPLGHAWSMGNLYNKEIITSLLAYGADPYQVFEDGSRPVDHIQKAWSLKDALELGLNVLPNRYDGTQGCLKNIHREDFIIAYEFINLLRSVNYPFNLPSHTDGSPALEGLLHDSPKTAIMMVCAGANPFLDKDGHAVFSLEMLKCIINPTVSRCRSIAPYALRRQARAPDHDHQLRQEAKNINLLIAEQRKFLDRQWHETMAAFALERTASSRGSCRDVDLMAEWFLEYFWRKYTQS